MKDIKKASLYKARKRESLVGRTDEFRQLLSDYPEGHAIGKGASQPTQPTSKIDSSKIQSINIDDLINKCRNFMNEINHKFDDRDGKSSAFSNSTLAPEIDEVSDSALKLSDDSDKSPFLNAWGKTARSNTSPKISKSKDRSSICNGLVIIIQVIVSQLRTLKYPQSRVISLMLLVRLGLRCSDDIIIQRVIPILKESLEDSNGYVRASALRSSHVLLYRCHHFIFI